MKYNPDVGARRAVPQRNRRSIRLKGYDYSRAGGYFVTACARNRECLFGNIIDGEMVLNDAGQIVSDEWVKSGEIRNEIVLDEFVIMPNHMHAIVFIRRGDRTYTGDRTYGDDQPCTGDRPVAPTPPMPNRPAGPRPKSIGALMAGFKSAVTKRTNEMRGTPGATLWQRNYYERVIRNDNELNRIREYIVNNPLQWHLDRENPDMRADR